MIMPAMLAVVFVPCEKCKQEKPKQEKTSVMSISDVLTCVMLQSSGLHGTHLANDVFCQEYCRSLLVVPGESAANKMALCN